MCNSANRTVTLELSDIYQFHVRMAATRRLQKELGDIRNSGNKSFRDVQVRNEENVCGLLPSLARKHDSLLNLL